jgi:hypothetical protein
MFEEKIARVIDQKIDDYHQKFMSPTPATIKRWKRQEARKLSNKNQLPLPLIFTDEPQIQGE